MWLAPLSPIPGPSPSRSSMVPPLSLPRYSQLSQSSPLWPPSWTLPIEPPQAFPGALHGAPRRGPMDALHGAPGRASMAALELPVEP
jgi:hypothetical protein